MTDNATLPNGQVIQIMYQPPRGNPSLNYPNGFLPNPLAAWCSEYNGQRQLTLREVWPKNGAWAPSKNGFTMPLDAAAAALTALMKALPPEVFAAMPAEYKPAFMVKAKPRKAK